MVKCKQESISKINGLTYKELWVFFFNLFNNFFYSKESQTAVLSKQHVSLDKNEL